MTHPTVGGQGASEGVDGLPVVLHAFGDAVLLQEVAENRLELVGYGKVR